MEMTEYDVNFICGMYIQQIMCYFPFLTQIQVAGLQQGVDEAQAKAASLALLVYVSSHVCCKLLARSLAKFFQIPYNPNKGVIMQISTFEKVLD